MKSSISFLFLLLSLECLILTHSLPEPSLDIPILPDDLPFTNLLSFGYYRHSCPDLERIINRKLKHWIHKDPTLAPSLIRLHFHDCAVTGCDGSILLDHEGSERRAKASETLRGFDVIEDIKSEIERKCPRTVSCTDILTAVARDATVLVGGPFWMVPYGRKDSKVSYEKDANKVPMGRESVTKLLEFFQSNGMNVLDLVVLSGAHTIGRARCDSIQYRLFNYTGTGEADPSIDSKYFNYLSRRCRWDTEYVDLDGTTPTTFDAQYYKNLEEKKGLLQTDQMLYSDARTSPLVSAFADQPWLFHHQFGASMVKLANIQVLTDQDEDGEIRTICSSINSNNY